MLWRLNISRMKESPLTQAIRKQSTCRGYQETGKWGIRYRTCCWDIAFMIEGCAIRPNFSLVTSFDANSPKLPHCGDGSSIVSKYCVNDWISWPWVLYIIYRLYKDAIHGKQIKTNKFPHDSSHIHVNYNLSNNVC